MHVEARPCQLSYWLDRTDSQLEQPHRRISERPCRTLTNGVSNRSSVSLQREIGYVESIGNDAPLAYSYRAVGDFSSIVEVNRGVS